MQKWEYKVVKLESDGILNPVVDWVNGRKYRDEFLYEYLDRAGENGWEVAVTHGYSYMNILILKRPTP